jgi:hypothetical protein
MELTVAYGARSSSARRWLGEKPMACMVSTEIGVLTFRLTDAGGAPARLEHALDVFPVAPVLPKGRERRESGGGALVTPT